MPTGEVVFSAAQIQERVRALAREINALLPEGIPHAVIALKGAVFFAVDLLREMDREVTIGFAAASSYGPNTDSAGEVRLRLDLLGEVRGRDVLLIEDILDTGLTLAALRGALRERRPASIRVCVLLDKPSRRKTRVSAEHVGFTVDERFLVGYGLDCGEAHRALPDIRAYSPEGEAASPGTEEGES